MDNAAFSDTEAQRVATPTGPPADDVSRGLSKRQLSHGYDAHVHPVDDVHTNGEGPIKERTRSVLPDLSAEDPEVKSWAAQTQGEKAKTVLMGIARFLGFLACLYFFICSLDLLSMGFKLLGGKETGKLFQNSKMMRNPVCGLMIGVMATVMVQSSSTSTSIVVAMTGSGILDIEIAVPIIMGANVGTSVTNTLVSLAQVGDRAQFERAFAGATVHDMFNWLSVFILLPLELATDYLAILTGALLTNYGGNSTSGSELKLLTVLTEPLTELVVQIDKKVIEAQATKNETGADNSTVLKIWCKKESKEDETLYYDPGDLTSVEDAFAAMTASVTAPPGMEKCYHLFATWPWLSDATVGAIVLVGSLMVLCTSLILLVKILNGVFKGSVGKILQKFLNAEIPGKANFLTGYVAMLVGAAVTILVQSSSVFTSTLTPLVGIGAVSIERFYPLTLGSNIGTTFTAMMAAFAASGKDAKVALQIALCHLFFNLSGILLFFPVPFLRRLPIRLAQGLGAITAEYRWFCAFYVIAMFIIAPAFIMGLSFAGTIVFGVIFGFIVLFVLVVVLINVLQDKRPHWLPNILKTWNFLPLPLRSLEPYDRVVVLFATKCCGCCKCVRNIQRQEELVEGTAIERGIDNEGAVHFDTDKQSVRID